MQAIGDVDTQCVTSLKEFICKFLFPACNATLNLGKPDLSVFSCGANSTKRSLSNDQSSQQRDAALGSNGIFSSYQTAAGKTKNYDTNQSTSSPPSGLK